MDILSTGYFLVSREAFRLMKRQKTGGAIVFVASKNGLAASPNAAAYCTAKAAEIHLARCLALEGAELGIRVNTVNPDAVLRGSKIWTGEWREQRAAAYNMSARRARGALPQALAAEAQRLSGGHRRGGLFLRLRHVGQIDRQHRQCRCRQRPGFHALSVVQRRDRQCDVVSSEQSMPRGCNGTVIDTRLVEKDNAAREAALKRDYDALGERLDRRGIAIDAIRDKVAGFRRRHAVLGRRHRRHALCPLSRRRRAARHLRQARGLRRHPAA